MSGSDRPCLPRTSTRRSIARSPRGLRSPGFGSITQSLAFRTTCSRPISRRSSQRFAAAGVLILGAETYPPDQLLPPGAGRRDKLPAAPDPDLESRALDMDMRLRRCCIRDGQVITVYDHRFAREHGDNMWQEDSCWLT